MSKIKQQLKATWLRNHQVTMLLLDELSPDQLSWHVNEKGKADLAGQFIHLHNIRRFNILKLNPKVSVETYSDKTTPSHRVIRNLLKQSGEQIANLIEKTPDIEKIKGYRNGYVGFITYLVNHESHHRSKIMMALKRHKVSFSKTLKFDIWDWKK